MDTCLSAFSFFFLDVGIIVCTASLLSLGLTKIRQPKVIAEVLGGILLGEFSPRFRLRTWDSWIIITKRPNSVRAYTRFHTACIPPGFTSIPVPRCYYWTRTLPISRWAR